MSIDIAHLASLSKLISGKNLQKIINLLQDLKEVAAEYADMVGEDVDDVYDVYEKLIKDIISSDLFEDIEYDDLFGQYSLDKILKTVGLTLNGRK